MSMKQRGEAADRIKEQVDAYFRVFRAEQEAAADKLAERGINCGGLNPNLVAKQKLTQADIDLVEAEHAKKDFLFKLMNELDPTDEQDLKDLHECVTELERVEFAMQRAWKFPEDEKFHTWWMYAPHCICPQMDNRDMLFYGRGKIMQQDCPLHGWAE